MTTRHTLALSLATGALALGGCSGGTPSADAGAADGAVGDGTVVFCNGAPLYVGAAAELAELGLTEGDTFTPWHDGDAVAYVWGFQGGTMITPTISAPATIARAGNPCVLVDVENLEPDGSHVFEAYPRTTSLLDAVFDGDRLELVGLFDQLGVSAIPEHTPLLLDVTVRGTAGAAHARVALDIVSSTTLPPECIALPTHGEGCVFRSIPATGHITAIRPVEAADGVPLCPADATEPMFVEYDLEVDAPYRACTTAPTRAGLRLGIDGYLAPPAQCLADVGLAVGGTFAATLDESIAGTCTPFTVSTTLFDVPSCTPACLGTP